MDNSNIARKLVGQEDDKIQEEQYQPRTQNENNELQQLLLQQRNIEDRLYLKQQEFDLQVNMEMHKLNELIVGQYNLAQEQNNAQYNAQQQQEQAAKNILYRLDPIKDEKLRRLPGNQSESYEKPHPKGKIIFQKIKDPEIRDLFIEMKNNHTKYDVTKYIDDKGNFLALLEEHKRNTINHYRDQPFIEYRRDKMLNDFNVIYKILESFQNLDPLIKEKSSSQPNSNDDNSQHLNKNPNESEEQTIEKLQISMDKTLYSQTQTGQMLLDEDLQVNQRDINKPKIWDWEGKDRDNLKYKDEVKQIIEKKRYQYFNDKDYLFHDEKPDITKEVHDYLSDKFKKHGVRFDEQLFKDIYENEDDNSLLEQQYTQQ